MKGRNNTMAAYYETKCVKDCKKSIYSSVIHLQYKSTLYLEITLISVKHYSFFFVVFSHHFHGKSSDSWLEVRLFSINHHVDVFFFTILYNKWLKLEYLHLKLKDNSTSKICIYWFHSCVRIL